MNKIIETLAYQHGLMSQGTPDSWDLEHLEKFAEALKQAIYDEVKEELVDDADIADVHDPMMREYLKGCNGGTVNALCKIKNFGLDIEL
jgi:hypothetical protein